jgi:hypothetical protein
MMPDFVGSQRKVVIAAGAHLESPRRLRSSSADFQEAPLPMKSPVYLMILHVRMRLSW